MKIPPLIRNPVARKRWRRFRERRRAWWSLWILAALYALSLAAELVCNDQPLYVRCEGRSFFPVLRFYPEDRFLHNGIQTRPDYAALKERPAFRDAPGNFMLFPPIPCGPQQTLNPDSLRQEEKVRVTLQPLPRVGTVDMTPGFVAVRATAAGSFFDRPDDAVAGVSVADAWEVSPALRAAAAARFRNEPCPSFSEASRNRKTPASRAVLSLSPFAPRREPPPFVRLTLRDPAEATLSKQILTFDQTGRIGRKAPALWLALSAGQKEHLAALAAGALAEPVPAEQMPVRGADYRLTVEKEEIRWPHAPMHGHWLGIDNAGRDVLARLLYGLRTSMTFGLILVLASTALGVLIGALQGYYAGKVDITAQRLIEVWSAMPFLYVMILMGSIYGRSFLLLLVCYGIFHWIGISYYMRAEFLRLRHMPFVEAARCMGIPGRAIMGRHILPNALTPIITLLPFSLVGAIDSLAALDYLGFGLPPPTPSWGELLQQAQQFRWAWWLILYPALMLFVVTLLGVFIGEGVRDAYDPRRFSRME